MKTSQKGFGLVSILIVIALVVVAGAGYHLYTKKASRVSATGSDTRIAQVAWVIESAPEDVGMPMSKVSIRFEGAAPRLIGTYAGSCTEIAGSSWTLQEGEKSGVICYYAGGGNEVGVFEVNGKLVIKEGVLDEGNAETPGVRAITKTILTLN